MLFCSYVACHKRWWNLAKLMTLRMQVCEPSVTKVAVQWLANLFGNHDVRLWARSQNCEKQLLASSRLSLYLSVFLSVRPSAWNNSATTGRIFMKFYIWLFLENITRNFNF